MSTHWSDFLRCVSQNPLQQWMSANPTYPNFEAVLKSIWSFRDPGPDSISLELIKHGGLPFSSASASYGSWKRRKFHQIWRMRISSPSSRKEIEVFMEITVESFFCLSQERSSPEREKDWKRKRLIKFGNESDVGMGGGVWMSGILQHVLKLSCDGSKLPCPGKPLQLAG